MASQAEIAATYDYLDELWRATRTSSTLFELARIPGCLTSAANGAACQRITLEGGVGLMTQWGKQAWPVPFGQLVAALRIGARALTDRNMHRRLQAMYWSSNQECFRRQLMHHQRIVFERRAPASL
jgi:hypothetical protein